MKFTDERSTFNKILRYSKCELQSCFPERSEEDKDQTIFYSLGGNENEWFLTATYDKEKQKFTQVDMDAKFARVASLNNYPELQQVAQSIIRTLF